MAIIRIHYKRRSVSHRQLDSVVERLRIAAGRRDLLDTEQLNIYVQKLGRHDHQATALALRVHGGRQISSDSDMEFVKDELRKLVESAVQWQCSATVELIADRPLAWSV